MDVTISITDPAALARVIAAVEELAGGLPADLVRLIGDAVARDGAMKRITNYPPRMYRPQPFKTAAQRRWFFANLRDGTLTVPYERTYRLRAGWMVAATATGAEVYNPTPYAGIVQGEPQSGYFQGKGWLNTTFVAQQTEAQDAPYLAAGAASLWIVGRGLG